MVGTPAQGAGQSEFSPRPADGGIVHPLRGLINPLLDRRMETDAKTRALIADLDAEALGTGEGSG